ncbi:MAG TPA: TraR/DksA C4-type zinc finger protein [Actinomycetota bacterium]|jgi:DnaK suppressor protein
MDTPTITQTLQQRRGELEEELRRLTERPVDAAPAVSFGKRIGDGTTEAVERINQVAAARSLDAAVREIDRALAKLEDGSYGICDRCGRLIPEERLEAVPWASLCVSCAGRR